VQEIVVPCGTGSAHTLSRICIVAGMSDPHEGFTTFRSSAEKTQKRVTSLHDFEKDIHGIIFRYMMTEHFTQQRNTLFN
jgi:hypothetical protein